MYISCELPFQHQVMIPRDANRPVYLRAGLVIVAQGSVDAALIDYNMYVRWWLCYNNWYYHKDAWRLDTAGVRLKENIFP